jgi:hypothetical protein
MLKCSQSQWTWWILGPPLAHQFKVKSKQLVHTFSKLNHLSKGLSQAHQPHRLNLLSYNLNWIQSTPQSSSCRQPWADLIRPAQLNLYKQLFLPTSRQMLKWQLLNLHYQALRLSKYKQPVITTLCIQIFNNWIKLTILQEVVIQQFGGLLKNLANVSTTMEMAWILVQEEINRAGQELFGTGSTVTINLWDNIQADFFHKC